MGDALQAAWHMALLIMDTACMAGAIMGLMRLPGSHRLNRRYGAGGRGGRRAWKWLIFPASLALLHILTLYYQ